MTKGMFPLLKNEEIENPILRVDTLRGVRFLPPAGSRNVKLVLSFSGTHFQGYQSQPHGNTVQNALEKAWYTLTKETPILFGCSRLDAGVHARYFVLNLFTKCSLENSELLRGLNGVLQSALNLEIGIHSVENCPPEFNARFDAAGKWYRYLVWYGRARHALYTPQCWRINASFFDNKLQSSLKLFEGTHDFSAFRASDCNAKNTVRTIYKINVSQNNEFPEMHTIDVFGEGFLKNMVRNIVGTAVDVCTGKLNEADILKCFEHLNRPQAGQCAPAHALTLWKVYYETAKLEADASKSDL